MAELGQCVAIMCLSILGILVIGLFFEVNHGLFGRIIGTICRPFIKVIDFFRSDKKDNE